MKLSGATQSGDPLVGAVDRIVESVAPNDARHDVRRQRITRTAWSGMAARVAMFLPTLGITAVVVPLLGPERFGVLITVLSLLAFLGLADLGIGASLVTLISLAFGANDPRRVRELQTGGLVVVTGISVILFAAGAAAAFGDIGSLIFPTSSQSVRDEATRALAVFAMLFALSQPLTLIAKVQLGMQRGQIANYWQIVAAAINFGAGVLAARAGLQICWIVAGLMTGTLVCGLANLLTHYRSEPAMRPRRADLRRGLVREVLQEAGFYLVLQVIFTFAYAADTLIVARQLGPVQASIYGLAERVFSIVAVAVSVVTGPMWAAYGEALGAADRHWARRMLWLSTQRIVLAAAVLSAALVLLLQPLVSVLSSAQLTIPVSLALAMGAWRVIEAGGSSLSAFMYASRAMRVVVALGAMTAAVSFTGKVVLLPQTGVFAVPLITSACYAVLCLLPTLAYLYRSTMQEGTPRTTPRDGLLPHSSS